MPLPGAEGRRENDLVTRALAAVNVIRREVGEDELAALPLGARHKPEFNCPIARALTALVFPTERRISFCYPWYASAAAKLWREPFTDVLLMSVGMPPAIYDFVVAFREGRLAEFEETSCK